MVNPALWNISSDISKFTDDSKIGRIIIQESDVKDLQGDFDRLNEWAVRWQMDVGKETLHNKYNISKVTMNRSECERD